MLSGVEALLYPQTYLRRDLAEAALQTVEQLVLLRPAEYPPEGLARELNREGRVRFLTPPPLGERLKTFLDLIRGYEEWGLLMRYPENVALFKGSPGPLEESVSEIKRALRGEDQREDDPVLSARIILALAERLDHKLESLDEELKRLEEKSRFLSRMIVGDTIEVRFPRWVTEVREPHWELPALTERLRAWKKLLPVLPELPETLIVDQPALLEEWADLAPQKMGSRSLGPGLEVTEWLYPLSTRELLELPPSLPQNPSGKTRVYFLHRL